MEFRQLTYFLAAAQTQNFRKAAELCMVAQSALSRQIAALEAELGVALFKRVDRRVSLTAAGQEFAVFASNALEQLQNGQHAMTALKEGERGTVVMGCVEALATTFLPATFARFHAMHPGIHLRVIVGGADGLIRMVEQGTLELGLIFEPSTHSELLVVRELLRQPLQLIVAPGHPLAQTPPGTLRLKELADEPLVVFGEGYGIRRIIERVFVERGLPFQPLVEIDSIEGLKEFVKSGVGVSFIPTALLRPDQSGDELVVLPVADLTEEFIFALVYRRFGTISRAAMTLIDAMTHN